jgi:hypothetical protein
MMHLYRQSQSPCLDLVEEEQEYVNQLRVIIEGRAEIGDGRSEDVDDVR